MGNDMIPRLCTLLDHEGKRRITVIIENHFEYVWVKEQCIELGPETQLGAKSFMTLCGISFLGCPFSAASMPMLVIKGSFESACQD